LFDSMRSCARATRADSGERDRPFRPKVITDSGDRDHLDPLGGGPG
jgi:hypothetical protein